MLRTLLFLSLVGAAIYGILVISGGNTNENQPIQTQNHPVGERLSSWGSYLAPSPSQNPQLATAQRPAQTPPQLGDDVSQNSERKSGTEYQLAASENKTPAVGAKPEPVEASVLSPSIGSSHPLRLRQNLLSLNRPSPLRQKQTGYTINLQNPRVGGALRSLRRIIPSEIGR